MAPWHAACCLFVASGCFYLGPMPTLEENVPPDPFAFTVDPNEPITIGEGGKTVLVIADDADGDEIGFTWILSDDGYVGNASPVPYDQGSAAGSQVHFEHDTGLDGQVLTCLVDDGVNDAVRLQWPMEVL